MDKMWNKKTPIDEKTFFFKRTCGTNFHSTYILTMLYLTAQFTDFVVACFGWSSNRKYNNVQRMRSSSGSGSWGSVTIFCQWTVGKHSLERMLLVKVWVPKTHPSFEKRETVLQFFLVHKTPAAGRPPPNFRLHLTWYRRQLCSPDIFQNHTKLFLQTLQDQHGAGISKKFITFHGHGRKKLAHKKLDLPHREENFFMETVFACCEIPFRLRNSFWNRDGDVGNMKKCISKFSLFDHHHE